MKHIPRSIHTILAEWGRANHALPPNNDAIKAAILHKVSSEKIESPSRRLSQLPWLSFTLTGLAVATLFLIPGTPRVSPLTYSSAPTREQGTSRDRWAPEENKDAHSPIIYPEPWPSTGTPITDRREFLKTNYNATLRTRKIIDLTQHIQTIIRGFGGRVDASSAATQWGQVAFAVPADRFEPFRREIKSLVPARFIIEAIHADNLLPQKRSIEEQEAYVTKVLTELKAKRESVVTTHTEAIRSLQNRIAVIMKDIARLRAEVTDNPQRKAEIAAEEQRLLRQVRSLEGGVAAENTAHANHIAQIDSKIKSNETMLEGIRTEDTQLIDSVATVEGHISLEWISIGEMIHLYVPLYWIAALFGLGAITALVVHQRRSRLIAL